MSSTPTTTTTPTAIAPIDAAALTSATIPSPPIIMIYIDGVATPHNAFDPPPGFPRGTLHADARAAWVQAWTWAQERAHWADVQKWITYRGHPAWRSMAAA